MREGVKVCDMKRERERERVREREKVRKCVITRRNEKGEKV